LIQFAVTWDHFRSNLGLDEPRLVQTLILALQVLLVLALAAWLSERVRRLLRDRTSADIASLSSRAGAFAIYAIGIAAVLSIIGLNPTAIAAILGAATLGITLALQDVAKSWANGIYILIERPFRISDRTCIGAVEGQVEEIGVRLTRLRTDTGAHILVPSNEVFSGVIQNATVGKYDRRQDTLSGINRPVMEIEAATVQALKSTPHFSRCKPVVEIVASGPDGTTSCVTVEHDEKHRIDQHVINRLRGEFQETSVSIEPPQAGS
jgi:hypothetical protein